MKPNEIQVLQDKIDYHIRAAKEYAFKAVCLAPSLLQCNDKEIKWSNKARGHWQQAQLYSRKLSRLKQTL